MIKTKELGAFIMIQNNFITETADQHLKDKELYLFSLLYREINLKNEVKTSVSILSDFSPIKFSTRKVRDTNEIKELLLKLIEKQIIIVCNSDGELINSNLKATESIVVSFLPNRKNTFTMIPFDKFESFVTMRNFYIYTAVERWKNAGYFECNYDRWSDILKCSRHSAIKYIEEAVEKEIIYKNTGDYIEDQLDNRHQKKQSSNQYKTIPFTEEEKSRLTRKLDYLEEKESEALEEDNVVVEFPSSKNIPENVADMF